MLKKTGYLSCLLVLGSFMAINCVSTPKKPPEPEATAKPLPPPPPPDFSPQPYHIAMNEEMNKSYQRANEIIIGVYTGSHEDEVYGLTYYFEDFSSFDKETLSWGQEMNVIFQVLPHGLNPVILTHSEFQGLSDLDRTGICWDSYEGVRDVYLIESEKMLIFLKQKYDEENNRAYRNLIDTYPVTKECNTKAVFDLMIREMYLR